MKDSEIYLRAAEMCANPSCFGSYEFACVAIMIACKNCAQEDRLVQEFADWFCPFRARSGSWFGQVYGEVGAHNSHDRVTALLFMHEIAKSEGR